MNKRKIFAFILSLTLIAGSFSACGNASTPGEKNDDELTKAPDSIELIDDDQKHSAEDVTAITGATDINGKVTDKVGITDKSGHKIYSTGQKDSAGMVIYTTGKKDSNGDILYTKNNIDSFGHQIYYTGKYDNGQLVLTPSQEKPDYTTNDNPTTVVSSTTTTVGADTNSKFVITDATCEFTKYFGGSGLDTMRSVDGTSDGGFVGVGNSQSFSGDYQGSSKEWGGLHSCIVKYDKDGTVEWKYIIGGDNGVTLKDVAELKDGTVIAVGETSSTDIDAKLNAKNLSSIIIRMNKKGELMWMYSFPNDGKSDGDYLSCVDATPDGGFVVGGKATSDSGFFAETKGIKAFLFKFDKNCNVKWRKVLSGSKSNNFAAVDVNSSGEIFATCVTASTDNDFSAIKFSSAATLNSIVMKFSKNGDLKWSDYLQGSGNSEYNAIAATDDGGCVVGGNFSILRKADGIYSTNYGKSDGYVIRYNSNGNNCY